MSAERSKQIVLDEEFLPLRARILELAAGLDRLDRAAGPPPADPRRDRIDLALQLLTDAQPDRAARVQLLFSREYDENWRDKFAL